MFQAKKSTFLAFVQVMFLSYESQCKYLGCFKTNSTRNVLNGIDHISSNMTIGMCCSFCSSKGFTVYALQYGRYCYCGTHENNYEILGGAPESECNTACAGAKTCGGTKVISVYEGHTYLACYQDSNDNSFTFGGIVTDLTIEACLHRCSHVYKYAGLKQGNKCYCSDSLPHETLLTNTSECIDRGDKCRGSDKCGGSGKIAVWTSIENLDKNGLELIGCYKDFGVQLLQRNTTLLKCAHLCKDGYLYLGMNSEQDCFCANALSKVERNIIKTMKLVKNSNGTAEPYDLKLLCNISNPEYLVVWKVGSGLSTDSYTWFPSQTPDNEYATNGVSQDNYVTNAPRKDNEESIPWLKVYPLLISSFFLGCITVILVICLSRSYESRRVMMQVRKQLTKQDKSKLTILSPTLLTANGDSMTTDASVIEDKAACSSVNISYDITPYDVAQCSGSVATAYEEVQKESSVSECVSFEHYAKVDRDVVCGNPSSSNPIDENVYDMPSKPALPTNPPSKIIKESKTKKTPKGRPMLTKKKPASRPTYAPPSKQSGKDKSSCQGTVKSNPNYSLPAKRAPQENRDVITSAGEHNFKNQDREILPFDIQPKNQIRFKKRSMFGSENVTKSFILSQGSDLSSLYSLPDKVRPKSSSAMSNKWKNSLEVELAPLGNESKLENITEHSESKISGSNEYSYPTVVDGSDATTNLPPISFRDDANVYHVIEKDIIQSDRIHETTEKQDLPVDIEI